MDSTHSPIRRLSTDRLEPTASQIAELSDESLEDRLRRLAGIEHRALALLLAHLSEFDARKLYADRGQPSMFAYCVRVLGYSEQGAYKRIQAARAARAHPGLLQHLADGDIHLAAIIVLAPHLRGENFNALLQAARGKSIRELEAMAAIWTPRRETRDVLRALPSPTWPEKPPGTAVITVPPAISGSSASPEANTEAPESPQQTLPPRPSMALDTGPPIEAGPSPGTAGPRERIVPLSAERFSFHFTADIGVHSDFIRARNLLRTVPPGVAGPMEAVFSAALGALLDRVDPERRDARRRRRAERRNKPSQNNPATGSFSSRRIARSLRDAVWTRDGGRCTFTGPDGQRCPAVRYLEIDHIKPYALGGRSDDPSNLRLTCRAHNQLLARRVFGKKACSPRG